MRKGSHYTPEQLEKLRIIWAGKERREKISTANAGRVRTLEHL